MLVLKNFTWAFKEIHCELCRDIWEQSFKEKDILDYEVSRIITKYQRTFNETMKVSSRAASKVL